MKGERRRACSDDDSQGHGLVDARHDNEDDDDDDDEDDNNWLKQEDDDEDQGYSASEVEDEDDDGNDADECDGEENDADSNREDADDDQDEDAASTHRASASRSRASGSRGRGRGQNRVIKAPPKKTQAAAKRLQQCKAMANKLNVIWKCLLCGNTNKDKSVPVFLSRCASNCAARSSVTVHINMRVLSV